MLRNLSIRSKFAAVLSVPLIGLLVLAVAGIGQSVAVAGRAEQTRQIAVFTDEVVALARSLQLERYVTGVFLDRRGALPLARLEALWSDGDQAAEVVRAGSRALALDPAGQLQASLDRSDTDLERVADLRDRIRAGSVRRSDEAAPILEAAQDEVLRAGSLANQATRERLTSIALDQGDSAGRAVLSFVVAVAVVLALAVGVSLPVAGAMVRSLRRLHEASLEVAGHRLPGVVARLRDVRSVADLDLGAPALAVGSRDEVGQVADAFNQVHRVAVRTAAEQAALRRSVGDMFMSLARRSQSLLDRQIKLIDQLERAEEDPDALEDLFKLDHLATRMRRNAENLIVLSGSEPARRWGQPVLLAQVVRAAVAEVEDYTRVEPQPLGGVRVAGRVVGDLVHLLAELIENAASFSPPTTTVTVVGQVVGNGYLLEIEDRGIGMTDADLASANRRLADPPAIDFALDRMLGFFVVGRLAQRYQIRVELRHSWCGGVSALVLLPRPLVLEDEAVPPSPPAAWTPPRVTVEDAGAAQDEWWPSPSPGPGLPGWAPGASG